MITDSILSTVNVPEGLLHVLNTFQCEVDKTLNASTGNLPLVVEDDYDHERCKDKSNWFVSEEYLNTITDNIHNYDYAESRFATKISYYKHFGEPNRVEDYDAYKIPHYRRIITELSDSLYPTSSIFYTNSICYDGPSAYLSWHTNLNNVGDRVYITYAAESNKSFFRYRDPMTGEIITCPDKKGWQINKFPINEEYPLWHCVHSDTRRISLGFRVVNNL
jgi:hypothetical protein